MQGLEACEHFNFSYVQRGVKTRTPSKTALRFSGQEGMRHPRIPFVPSVDVRGEVGGERLALAIYSARGRTYLSGDICFYGGGVGHCVLSGGNEGCRLPELLRHEISSGGD